MSGNNSELWHATYDGSNWSTDTRLPNHQSLEGPALAVFDNKLYCVHRGYGEGDQDLWWTFYSGNGGGTYRLVSMPPVLSTAREPSRAGETTPSVSSETAPRRSGTRL